LAPLSSFLRLERDLDQAADRLVSPISRISPKVIFSGRAFSSTMVADWSPLHIFPMTRDLGSF
jgi:hypothetical protein